MTRISFAETRLEGAPAGHGGRWMGACSRCATRAPSSAVFPRLPRSSAGMLFFALVLVTLAPALGHAALRDVTIRWNPSPSEGVVSYLLSIGTSPRTYTHRVHLSDPSVSGDVWSQTVQLDDSSNQYLALRAMDGFGRFSGYSNEIVIAGDGGDSEPPGDPDFGVTSLQGIPSVASGEIFVEALVDVGTESVEFRLDDLFFRIENFAPYSLNGDNGPGALNGWDTRDVADGSHTISATAYSQDGAGGEMGRTVSVTFEVRNASTEPLGVPGKPRLVLD